MDSLTQIVLGAAVGEAVCGKKIGNKAMIAGAIAGTIPDLDVLIRPFVDVVDDLYYHRSFTHSIFFAIIFAPLFAWLSMKLLKKWQDTSKVTFKEWFWLYFLGFFTHAILDCFTTWGTKILYPLTDYAVAFYSVFVIDPFYTVPFILFLLLAAFTRKENPRRGYYNYAGIAISSAYLMIGLVNKNIANQAFEGSMANQKISYQEYISKPTIMNSVLWAVSAKSEEGFHLGLYSLLDDSDEVKMRFMPKNHHLLAPFLPHPKLERLMAVTKGYYAVELAEKGIYINDLRFGEFNGWKGEGGEFVFVYHVWEGKNGELVFEKKDYKMEQGTAQLAEFWDRLKGNP